MKFSSPALFAAFLIGAAVAQDVASASGTDSPAKIKIARTDQEKADQRAQREAEKAQKAAEKEASKIERQASKAAQATAVPEPVSSTRLLTIQSDVSTAVEATKTKRTKEPKTSDATDISATMDEITEATASVDADDGDYPKEEDRSSYGQKAAAGSFISGLLALLFI